MREKQFTLSRKQHAELVRRYKQERDRRVAERIQCILLLHEGKNAGEVARILRVSKKTIKRWIKIFVRLGVDGLATLRYEQSGAVCELTPAQQQQLEKYLDAQVRGSAKEVRDYIEKEWGVRYSDSGVLKLLKRLNYRYKKPALLPAKADADQQAAFVAQYQEKKPT